MALGKFEFNGSGLSLLWLSIWTTFLTIITFSIFTPWAYVAYLSWFAKNVNIDGKSLIFKGTGLGFFGTFLLILLFTIITFGIYAPWGACRSYRWAVNNMYFAEEGDIEKI